MCNEEIIKHMKEDMTFRGLSEKTMKSYVLRVKKYMVFHKGKNIEELTEDDIRDFLKYLGAQIGFSSILHTWGQNLKDHPHIHCIVLAGGLDSLGK